MDYDLNKLKNKRGNSLLFLFSNLQGESKRLILGFFFMLINSAVSVSAPLILGDAIDQFLKTLSIDVLFKYSAILTTVYVISSFASYFQIIQMGTVGQDVLFRLRNRIFDKLQELPLEFFNKNKSGDLISRINNDTDKINSFFSEGLLRFAGSMLIIIGTAITVLTIKVEMGLTVLVATVVLIVLTRLLSPLLKSTNALGLKSTSNLSSQIQEDLTSFKVIVTSNKRNLLADTFNIFNRQNYKIGLRVDLLNQTLKIFYDAAGNISLFLVLLVGLKLVIDGQLTIGILISYITYTQKFYDPLRQLAGLWSNVQLSFAAADRVQDILSLSSNLERNINNENSENNNVVIELKNVKFAYSKDRIVLDNLNLKFEEGKTYALVGPTGGGKSTTASIIARLYDPTEGEVLLKGKNIKEYSEEEVSKEIGFILQDPFIFSGTIEENIKYGNPALKDINLKDTLTAYGLNSILDRFTNGLDEKIDNQGVSISLGQKQIIAFIRAILRNPSFLILDEATANIDTVTENILEEILNKLPAKTTKIIIAHRLNTIEKSDQIIFISNGRIQTTSNFEDAKDLILHAKRNS